MRTTEKTYQRFSLAQRIEHLVLIVSFSTLGLTGMPQKYPLSPISLAVIDILGGIETIRIIHRVAATIFLLEAIYHLVVVGYKLWVQRRGASMVPTVKDGTDAIQSLLYNLGIRKTSPQMPRYNFAEKAEYWAMLWGLLVMAATGFMLWNPIATTNILPGSFIPAAKIAHGGEAVLAVLAIILWHFYNVHIRHLNPSMFTGRMSREAMAEEHGAELQKIEAGQVDPVVPEAEQRERLKIFAPLAAVFTLVMMGGVYWFVTFEESAITTLPPAQQAQVFAPQTPTTAPTATVTPTPAPDQSNQGGPGDVSLSWEGGLQDLFTKKCGSCHGTMGGFSAKTYVDLMEAVNPGDADNSLLVEVQKGTHPGKLSDEELSQVTEWIQAGAPEK